MTSVEHLQEAWKMLDAVFVSSQAPKYTKDKECAALFYDTLLKGEAYAFFFWRNAGEDQCNAHLHNLR